MREASRYSATSTSENHRAQGPDGQWRGSSGVTELGAAHRSTPTGWFRIGSVTKTFTAAVVLTIARDGLITLDGHL